MTNHPKPPLRPTTAAIRAMHETAFVDAITAICQFHADNYYDGDAGAVIEPEGTAIVSYTLACMLAQRYETPGVETEWPMASLRMTEWMEWAERRALVVSLCVDVQSSDIPVPMYRELPVAKTDPVADSEGTPTVGDEVVGLLRCAHDRVLWYAQNGEGNSVVSPDPDDVELVERLAAAIAQANPTTELFPAAPTVGMDHPRAGEWLAAVSFGNTVLGLVDWLEANPAKPVRQGHTHGPLFAESPTRVWLRVAGGLSPHVARTDTEDMPLALQRANARRIVACWNACSEIETAELEGSYLLHQRDNVYTLASQR